MSDVRNFGATGDGKTDDTDAIRHAVAKSIGVLRFSTGTYRISGTIEIPLGKRGPSAITGDESTSRVVMAGPGPAFRIVGNHGGTGDPRSIKPSVWDLECMPTVRNMVVEGAHPEADGFELIGTMQSLFEGVLVRRVRHGIHLVKRNRNVLISHCHIYHNKGVGIFLDGVNLHQINITGSHISYNRLGGIRIENSEVRNLQITGNDIEYNNAKSHPDLPSEPTAEIWIDTTAEKASVNEVAIASNTIQATESAGGANIRIMEKPDASRPPGLITITGNVIGSQENNIHLTGGYGISISGNTIYSCGSRNLLIEDSRQITVGNNIFRRHTPTFGTGVRITGSQEIIVNGCTFHDEAEGGQKSGASLLELANCQRINVTGSQFTDGVPYGIDAADCQDVRITSCMIAEVRPEKRAKGSIRFQGKGAGNHIALCSLDRNPESKPESGLQVD
jgi:polygalacturonase